MDLYAELCGLVHELEDAGVEYALGGRLALAVYGIPQETQEIDLLGRPADLSSIRQVAYARGFESEVLVTPFSDEGLTIQCFSKLGGTEPLTLDVLLINKELESVWNSRTWVEFEGGRICVVSRRGLITLKLKAGRPQDLADVQQLQELEDDDHHNG